MFALKKTLQIYLLLLIWCPWACLTETDDAYDHGKSRAGFPSLDCTFATGICSWRHSSLENELKWGISEISHDHTTGTSYYLRLYKDRVATILRASLRSPPVQTSAQTCLTFWYFMQDNDVLELSINRIELARNEKQQLFRVFGAQGNQWYRAVVPTGSGEFQLEIIGTVDENGPKLGIGVDDISFSYEECSLSELESIKNKPRVSCDFEENLCSWYNQYNFDQVEWRLVSYFDYLNDRYPLAPLTDGNGMAGLVRLADGYNADAKLQGPTISVDGREACFSFWYRSRGDMVKELKVHAVDYLFPYDTVTLYNSGQPMRPTWIQVNLTLPRRENFHIIFSAMTVRDRSGAVLIDDINLSYGGPCDKGNQEDLINCDFDKDLCRWYLTTDRDKDDWARIKGTTPTEFTGPSHDHTTGDGHYVFFYAANVETAYFYSQDILVDSEGACFSFWYYMYGEDVYTLQLLMSQQSGVINHLWNLEGSQENKWLQQNVSLSSFNKKRGRLIFIAESVYFPRGDIALDDISITFGAKCESDIPETDEPFDYEETTITEEEATSTYIPPPSTTEITELPTPLLVLKDGLNTVYQNSRVELECQFHTNVTVMTKWYRIKEGREKMRLHREGVKRLVFDEIQHKEGGTFACTIQYGYDVTSDFSNLVKIKVVDDPRRKPFLYSSAPDYPLQVDIIVTLSCGFIDVNGATYHWRTTSTAFSHSDLPNARDLVLNGTKLEHAGVYSCRISKDEFMTAKSRELKITVAPGKPCDYNWQCSGEEYKARCIRKRCKCDKNATPVGPRCLFKPEQPKLLTYPRYLEYGNGESFYLICRAKTPAPPLMTYTFITPKGQIESHSVLKITNSTELDSGFYQCYVTYNNVSSRHSNDIIVQIKEFTNLSCDFHKDFCKWSQRTDLGLSSFEHIMYTDKERPPGKKDPGAYIQVPKNNSDSPNKAVLISSTIDRTTLNCCLTFQYQMLGSEIRDLTVWTYKFTPRLQGDGGTRMWTAVGEKGRRWMEKKISIPPAEDFFIAFEAIGPVAIADIRFVYRGGC